MEVLRKNFNISFCNSLGNVIFSSSFKLSTPNTFYYIKYIEIVLVLCLPNKFQAKNIEFLWFLPVWFFVSLIIVKFITKMLYSISQSDV